MPFRTVIAKAASSMLTWGLRHVAHRPGATLPGKVALRIDPRLIAELRGKMRKGSIVVVGTNGKTTVTNLLADVVEKSGQSVLCNRTGSNLKQGIATVLLQSKASDWGVIECDELWTAKVLPDLRPTYMLLLNLFRDQLDRCGEIDRIQDAIVSALEASPDTTLVYNADDPLCAFVAQRLKESREAAGVDFKGVPFGVAENMNLAQNVVADATMCQACSHMFEYEYRQYGQLGSYRCPNCGFRRPALDFAASGVDFESGGMSFEVEEGEGCNDGSVGGCNDRDSGHEGSGKEGRNDGSVPNPQRRFRLQTQLAGSYMVYNLLAVYAAASLVGCSGKDVQEATSAFDPKNGRLQEYFVDGRRTLLNLAKNPTGFNQNLRIVASDKGPKGVAFFINDQVVDGHDVSWIWDIDFEELVAQPGIVVFAGGSRRNDLQVRLKYAGVNAMLIDSIADAFAVLNDLSAAGKFSSHAPVYAIANYSSLPAVKVKLDELSSDAPAKEGKTSRANLHAGMLSSDKSTTASGVTAISPDEAAASTGVSDPVVIAHVLPDLLNLYGDGGNVRILQQRLDWRGIPVEVCKIKYGDPIEFDDVDLVFLGGGPDREQKLATEELEKVRGKFADYIADGGPLLAICGGFQILGRTWLLGDDLVPGLGVFGFETRRPGTSADRLVDNVALKTPIADLPVIGYENHAGRTYLDAGVKPFGVVASKTGGGNNDDASGEAADGIMEGNVIGTYLHGTLLAKNPEVADWILERALERHARRTGTPMRQLDSLDDSEEIAANEFMAKKLM